MLPCPAAEPGMTAELGSSKRPRHGWPWRALVGHYLCAGGYLRAHAPKLVKI